MGEHLIIKDYNNKNYVHLIFKKNLSRIWIEYLFAKNEAFNYTFTLPSLFVII
jgi:hypothetical protein